LIVDRRVKAVTLTGSDRAGSAVASTAGRELKKSVLELGGSDPFIVMPSADLELALSTAVKARTINTGQSCIAAKRFFIADKIYDQFLTQFVEKMGTLKVGDPLDETTEIGPLATAQILHDVDDQVHKSVAAGAKLLTGGNRVHGPGFFYEPTVLIDVPKNRRLIAKKFLDPLPPSSASAMKRKRSRLRTTAFTDWARAFGRATKKSRSSLPQNSRPEWCSSTEWSLPIRACRLVV